MNDDIPISISVSGGPSVETTLGALKAAGDGAVRKMLPATRVDASDLVATIERARQLLDDGDYEAALLLSSGAYEQAKAAAGYAEKVKASRQLIDKARRMQADALKIESVCYVAMANTVDEAQAKGQVARPGQKANVQGSDIFTLEDVGVDRRRLSEARKIRDAEAARPGFIERTVEARLEQGLEPSRAGLKDAARHAIGTKSRSQEERGRDAYFTGIEAMRTVLALESFSAIVKEPACGEGGISKPLEAVGYDVMLADIHDYGTATRDGELQQVGDFLESKAGDTVGIDICSNPPYGRHVMNRFIAHALREHKPRKMALLLNSNAMFGCEDEDRLFIMDECPPSRVYIFSRRLPMMHQKDWDGPEASSQMNTAWYVWERNEDGSYGNGRGRFEVIRVDWKAYETAPALPPGAGGHASPLYAFKDEFERDTPRKTLDERVEDISAKALIWCAGKDDFDAVELRRAVGVRPSTADGAIHWMLEKKLIDPAGEGRFKVASGGWTALKATAAVINDRKLFELIEQVQGVAA